MSNPNCKRWTVEVFCILVALINFSEQIFIYLLAKLANIGDEREQLFFWIITGIAVVSILKVLAKSVRKQIVILAFIEVGEVITYYFIFYQTLYAVKPSYVENFQSFLQSNTMAILIGVLCVIELTLLVVMFIIVESSEDNNTCTERLINLLIEAMFFVLTSFVQATPIYFLQSKSSFRSVYYEVLTAINLFIHTEIVSFHPSFDFAVRNYCTKMFRLQMKAMCCCESFGKIYREMKPVIREYTIDVKKALHICHSRIGRYWFYFLNIADSILGIITCIKGIVYINRDLANHNLSPSVAGQDIYGTIFAAIVIFVFVAPSYLIFVYQIYIYCKRSQVSPTFQPPQCTENHI